MATDHLTAQRLRELLHYDPSTGVFVWIVSPSNCVKVGDRAGSLMIIGYVNIQIDKKLRYGHRLAWLYVHGQWPPDQIDHINGIRHDNRLANLRSANRSINTQNIHKAKSSNRSCGMLGVLRAGKKWRARIEFNGKSVHLGCFDTPETAHAAYVEAKRRLHPGCTI